MDKWRCYKNRIQNAYVRYFGYLLDLSKGFIFNLSFMLGMFIYLFFIISSAINIPGITIFTLGGFIVIVVLILYVDTIKHVLKNAPPRTKTHTAFVLSVYPVRSIFHKDFFQKDCIGICNFNYFLAFPLNGKLELRRVTGSSTSASTIMYFIF